MSGCPDCGGELQWLEIMGDVARPGGSIYECGDCGSTWDERDLSEYDGPTCPGCGTPVGSDGVWCTTCAGGRL